MDDYSILIFSPEDDEPMDSTKYKLCDVVDYRTREIVGKIYLNKETGEQEYVQFKKGK